MDNNNTHENLVKKLQGKKSISRPRRRWEDNVTMNAFTHLRTPLTLILLTWTIWRTPTNTSKWRIVFNSAFKGLKTHFSLQDFPFSYWYQGDSFIAQDGVQFGQGQQSFRVKAVSVFIAQDRKSNIGGSGNISITWFSSTERHLYTTVSR